MTKLFTTRRYIPAFLLIAAGMLAYGNSFDGVFLHDDIGAIRDNVHIRRLWPLSEAMSLPLWETGSTVDGRPLLSLSFALNHALFGSEPWGYHLVNILIHITAGLLLFGVLRRTFQLPQFCEWYGNRATGLALSVALIWLVHPLQTESVTYIVQRAESLMGMLFLLTLYCSIRGFGVRDAGCEIREEESEQKVTKETKGGLQVSGFRFPAAAWLVAAALACAAGMGVKQTMFSAPILVFLYDGIFVSDSFCEALKKRKKFYAALCATWLIVFGIIAATWKESTIDFVKISPVRYLMTQPMVLLYYLRLSVWPSPLVLDYAWPLEEHWHRIVFPGLVILGLLGIMLRGIWKQEWYGFVWAWFFLILAPTSSIAPTKQAIFEHRMYLSLAAVIVFVVMAVTGALKKLVTNVKQRTLVGGCLSLALVGLFGSRTLARNRDYHRAFDLWQGNVLNRPASFHAHVGLGDALRSQGKNAEAISHYRTAVQLRPGDAGALNNLGNSLLALNQPQEAVQCYQAALKSRPDHAEAHNNWGKALEMVGQREQAIAHYQEAIKIDQGLAGAHLNLGNSMQAAGQTREALGHYLRAAEAKPDYSQAHNNAANCLLLLGKPLEAIERYRELLRIEPGFAEAHYGLGLALDVIGDTPESVRHFQEALRLNPTHDGAREHLRKAEELRQNR